MMYSENKVLIVGLGNIGLKYANTRHNIGFLVADYVANKHSCKFQNDNFGDTCRVKIKNKTLILLKPSTYMNLSGKAVLFHVQREKISPEHLLIISDDIALDFGQVRIRKKGGAGGHNGLQNIIDHLQTTEFARIRIGIGNSFVKGYQSEYVLSPWNDAEAALLPQIISFAVEACESFVLNGIDLTMNRFNGKQIFGDKP